MAIPNLPTRPGRLLVPIFILVACLSTLFAATLSAQDATETDDQATLEAQKAANPPLSSAASARVYRPIQARDELFAGIDNTSITYSNPSCHHSSVLAEKRAEFGFGAII